MSNNQVLDDQLSATPELRDLVGTVFIVPVDAPLPADLEPMVANGQTLLSRLAPIDTEPETFGICALTGQEMFDIASCFTALATAKRVALLEDLPGARYDALMIQGVRRAGLKTLQWPRVAEFIEQRRRLEQRTADSKPWTAAPITAGQVDDDGTEVI